MTQLKLNLILVFFFNFFKRLNLYIIYKKKFIKIKIFNFTKYFDYFLNISNFKQAETFQNTLTSNFWFFVIIKLYKKTCYIKEINFSKVMNNVF